MRINFLENAKAWLLVFLFLVVGVTDARADFQLTDDLILSGYLRQTCAINMGTNNPNRAALGHDKNTLNLMRTHLQVELDYRPTEIFRVFTKMRAIHDQTSLWDSDVHSYDAFPWTGVHHGLDLKTGYGEDHFNADIWEIWANLELDTLWIRLGKQQIAWGDVPGLRVADVVNPLDRSWHLELEPEEFENIRIPEWAARVYYTLPETATGPFSEIFIDGFINPGDIHPDMQPSTASPFDKGALSAANEDPDFDLRGEEEWGVRLGFNIGQLQTTLNYASVHNDYPVWDFFNAPEEPMTANGTVYPEIDVYAVTMSYALTHPAVRTIVSFEGSYTPDQPWQSTAPGPPAVEEGGFVRGVIWAERDMFILSDWNRFFYPGKLLVLYYRHHIRDASDVKLTPAPLSNSNRLDWNYDVVYVKWTQGFGQGKTHEIAPGCFWSPDGAYKIQCFYKWQPNYKWRVDLGLIWQGGSGDRAFMYSNQSWQDEAYARITWDF